MATEDARYRTTSQYRLWSFSPTQLLDLRAKTNALASSTISSRLDPAPDFLSPSDEQQLVTYYTVELLRAATFCEFPTDVRATAAVFLRRFYVTNSIMTYPPQAMLKTALFFGAKAEGFYIRLNKIADKFQGTTPEQILAGEFLLCEGIRFAFDVRHPYRGLEGAVMELRRLEDVEENRIKEAHKRAREILKFSPLVTDAYFHYTPSQITLAALSLADRGLVERLMRESFKQAQAQSASNNTPAPPAEDKKPTKKKSEAATADRERIIGDEVLKQVMKQIEACREMLAAEPPERYTDFWGTKESTDAMKPLSRKLKKCRDPDRFDLVALQKARRERELNNGDSDDDVPKYADKKTSLKEDGGVFGGELGPGGPDAKRRKVSKAVEDPFGGPL